VAAVPWCQEKRLAREAFRRELDAAILARPKTPVRGLDKMLAREWQRTHGGQARISHPVLAAWIDFPRWRAALEGNAFEAAGAWRALQLDAWLKQTERTADDVAATRWSSAIAVLTCTR
jgi:hypothetical protein